MMPFIKLCSYPGCKEVTTQTRCAAHAAEKRLERNHAAAYKNREWRNCRLAYLRQNPLCADCLDHQRTTAAREVHHIVKVSIDPSRRLDFSNLRALCKSCHSIRTARGE